MRYKVKSLTGSRSIHDGLKQETKTLLPLKLLLPKDEVLDDFENISKTASVIDFIDSKVTTRRITRNDVIVYSMPDKIP